MGNDFGGDETAAADITIMLPDVILYVYNVIEQ